MPSPESWILIEQRGWDDASLLEMCLEYIDNQADDTAFEQFLMHKAEQEDETIEYLSEQQALDEERTDPHDEAI